MRAKASEPRSAQNEPANFCWTLSMQRIDVRNMLNMRNIRDGAVTCGLLFGVAAWLVAGGYAFIQHSVLLGLLRRAHVIPRHYPRFLDHAADHILLRMAG